MDLAPGAFNSTGNTRNGRTAGARTKKTSGTPRITASKASQNNTSTVRKGAVRVSSQAHHTEPRNYLSKRTKLYTALAAVIGGIVWTSLETTPSTRPLAQQAVVRASMPAPTFFFDDAVDALSVHFSQQENDKKYLAETAASAAVDIAMRNPERALVSHDTTLEQPGAGVNPVAGERSSRPALQGAPHSASTQVEAQVPASDTTIPSTPGEPGNLVITVEPGNTLSGIMNDHGVSIEQINPLLSNEQVKTHLSRLDVGQQMTIRQQSDGELESLSARVGADRRITITREDGEFSVSMEELSVESERVVTSGTIQQSLYLAAQEANLKQSTIMALADIFQWELDFARDIRKGDQFSLVYDRLYREGEYIGDGDILAAEFVRGGKIHRAIRFTTDDGRTDYYSPDGQPKRRTFMRHPVDVVRITSRFDPNRMHPVLHKIRAHRGVDYGSPAGSPIYATADGQVTYSGMKSSYGNTVVLQHGQRFSTLYAHMSRIADKAKSGMRVKQGDVIGYVGATGLVSGAHLHYEFRVNNMHVDPLKVKLPAAPPIDAKYLPDLQALSLRMTDVMERVRPSFDRQVASASPTPTPAPVTTDFADAPLVLP